MIIIFFSVITGEKPHPCEVCGKPFRVRSDMKRHLNTHSRRRNNRPSSIIEASTTVIEVPDEIENSESIIIENDIERSDTNVERESEEQVNDASGYPRDPLEAVREGTNTLYVMPILIA